MISNTRHRRISATISEIHLANRRPRKESLTLHSSSFVIADVDHSLIAAMSNAKTDLVVLTELNPEAPSTIVLIHGAFSNSTTWDVTARHLPQYHLLMPDLPGHGRSRAISPSFSLDGAANEIARIIRLKGKNGKARIVGLSLGAHVTLEILTRHPDVVEDDAALLGLNIWSQFNTSLISRLGWFGTRVMNLVPDSKKTIEMKKTADGTLLPPMPYSYWQEVFSVICEDKHPQPWPARTLIVQAGKKGGAPVTDRPSTALMLQEVGRKGNPETTAFWNDSLVHPWPMEQGELCAQMLLAWFEARPLPEGFVKM